MSVQAAAPTPVPSNKRDSNKGGTTWQDKVERAVAAREQGKQIREGKAVGFVTRSVMSRPRRRTS